jgi:2-polyprenyl-3-methyl-5-hydroxy-6-metoxy-1,4-benzoquinol methylase
MSEYDHWQGRYQKGDTPWETGKPSTMLTQVVADEKIASCRAIDLGCGTGTNAVWLAQQGFDVVGVDLSPWAIEQARKRAKDAGASVEFVTADLLAPPNLGKPFRFVFDRGCYHVIRKIDVPGFFRTIEKLTEAGTLGLVLAGNANEKMEPGPPVVTEQEFRDEWGTLFDVIWLREFRFDETPMMGHTRPLGWAGLLRRK